MYRDINQSLPLVPSEPRRIEEDFRIESMGSLEQNGEKVEAYRFALGDSSIGYASVTVKDDNREVWWDLFYPLQAFDDEGAPKPTGRGIGTLAQNRVLSHLLDDGVVDGDYRVFDYDDEYMPVDPSRQRLVRGMGIENGMPVHQWLSLGTAHARSRGYKS